MAKFELKIIVDCVDKNEALQAQKELNKISNMNILTGAKVCEFVPLGLAKKDTLTSVFKAVTGGKIPFLKNLIK